METAEKKSVDALNGLIGIVFAGATGGGGFSIFLDSGTVAVGTSVSCDGGELRY
jgi:hypothetical protein